MFWGTGFGSISNGQTSPSTDPNAGGVEVLFGNKTAKALYAGPSGCSSGTDQIVFQAPAGIEGCYIPIAVKFGDGDISRNFGTVSIRTGGGPCSDPHILSTAEADTGEALNQGSIRLNGHRGGAVTGRFSRRPLAGDKGDLEVILGTGGLPPFGSCIVNRYSWYPPFSLLPARSRSTAPTLGLGAGRFLNLRLTRSSTPSTIWMTASRFDPLR